MNYYINWGLCNLPTFKLPDTGTVDRRMTPGSGRPRTASVADNIDDVDFIPPNLWPPNSPNLNPVDCKIWSILQKWVYKTSIKDVDELRCRIAKEWDKLDQRIIDKPVGELRKRLRACVAAGGGQFEHKM